MQRLAAGLLLLGCCASCFSVMWERHRRFERIPDEALAGLATDAATMQTALDALGAPLYVWELPREGVALAYGWYDGRELGAQVSVPLTDSYSASLSYNDIDASLYGVVLSFDAGRTLRFVRRGTLRDLAAGLDRRRPSFDQDAGADAGSGP